MNAIEKIVYRGFDGSGIARVWGEHESSHDVAEARCLDAAKDYIHSRPDTGPLAHWSFTHNKRREAKECGPDCLSVCAVCNTG